MKKNVLKTAIMLLMMLLAASCHSPEEEEARAPQYTRITAEEARSMMDAGNVTVVDVRTPEEFAGHHIEGAVNIPNETIGSGRPALLPDGDAVILIYCRSGRRSREAAMKLIGMGYGHVYDFGGINDWPYGTVEE